MPTPYDWPASDKLRLIGKDISRIEGVEKVTGRAKYTCDTNVSGMLYASTVTCPYAHAKVKSINTSAAAQVSGFKAVLIIQAVGTEIMWAGDDVVAVAAVDAHAAEMAAQAIVVEYDVLPWLVNDADPNVQAAFLNPMDPELKGDPDAAFAADATHEGTYGLPVITHCCLETHGIVATWTTDSLKANVTTQSVAGIPAQLSQALTFPRNNIEAVCQYVGGAFGSKLAADRWGLATARLSKLAGGAPVKWLLDRRTEQEAGGCRPSAYGTIQVAAKTDGTLTGWQSVTWSTGGIGGGGEPPLPYLFNIPNQRRKHTQIVNNIGSARSMRAPHNPQACLLTLCALDDLAAKLNINPVDFLSHNLGLVKSFAATYRQELKIADELMGWSLRWKPRGTPQTGEVRTGLGVAMQTWSGTAHDFRCTLSIHPDGSITVQAGTQDIGTGTRTVLAIVAAETFGLPVEAIAISIGDSTLPACAGSGGSGTVGGGGSAVRRAAVDALKGLTVKVASSLGTTSDRVTYDQGTFSGPANATLTWRQACAALGTEVLTTAGANPGDGALASSGVGGVQMANVSVDIRTGIVRVNKIVAVQDCGLVIDRMTTTSQVYGSLIMGIGYSLYEEKIMDPQLGRMLNPNIEFYRLCGIGDTGELVVHLMSGPGYDERGIVGCGEPAVIGTGAAISNAVANAIGCRVPQLPLTPDRVLAALTPSSP